MDFWNAPRCELENFGYIFVSSKEGIAAEMAATDRSSTQPMIGIGIALFGLTVLLILIRYFRAERPYPFPFHGYAGATILVAGEVLLFAGVEPVVTYFTPIAWTGYILWADAAVFSLRGRSMLKTYPKEFAWIALCSIPLWLVFEAYNLRLRNWIYVGLPEIWLARQLGYAWAFATIWPAILETAALWRATGLQTRDATSKKIVRLMASPTARTIPNIFITPMTILAGALLLIAPLLIPQRIGSYLFGAVWLGFILFLEPINRFTGRASLWKDLQDGNASRLWALLASGLICGIFWEFWNYWAQARWVYLVPILPELKIFAMPVLGYLGFPPFAVECFAMFAFVAPFINRVRKKLGEKEPLRWEALEL